MWMMGYSEGGEINNTQDPFTGRKLRPLVPRTATATAAAAASINPHCLTRLHGTDLLTLNHHLATMAEQNKRELTTQQVVVSSRWNPTPEQLQTLEELYRRGTRTPSAEQIQHITAQLRRHGKIEGKNVFYWFQNHKARERQKRRRQIESISDERQPENNRAEKEEPRGGNRSAFEVEQTKNWASPTNPSTLAEMSGQVEAECKEAADGWVQFDDDAELQRRRNATWRTMSMSCSSSPTSNLINPSAPTVTSAAVPSSLGGTTQIKPLNVFLEPYNDPLHIDHHTHGGAEAAQTLQLFPLRSGSSGCCRRNEGGDDDEEESGAAMNTVAPFQFFEFLPLKN